MAIRLFVFFIILLIGSEGCKNKKVQLEDIFVKEYAHNSNYQSGEIVLEFMNQKKSIKRYCIDEQTRNGWNEYKKHDYACYYPNGWTVTSINKYLFYANIDSSNLDYAVGIRYNMKLTNMKSLFDYVAEVHNQMVMDTVEIVLKESYYFMKSVNGQSLFFAEFETRKKSNKFTIYACYTESDGEIFDHTIKFSKNSIPYCEFISFLSGVRINGKVLYNIQPETGFLKVKFSETGEATSTRTPE